MMKEYPHFSKLRVESLEERTLLAVMAGGIEQVAELAAPTEAQTWIVNTLEDPTSWDTTDSVLSLREAIDSAVEGDTIFFDGSLAGNTIMLNGTQIEIHKDITIDATEINGITIDADGMSRVLDISGGYVENPIHLIGLTITGGNTADLGGGIRCWGSTLKMTNCTVSGNTAGFGGGIEIVDPNYSHKVSLINCTISGNTAKNSGGGIEIELGGPLSLTNCTISGNTAHYFGGGIYMTRAGLVSMTNCVVVGNTSTSEGGGFFISNSSLIMTNCSVVGNSSMYNGGGGIFCSYSEVYLYNTIVALNHGDDNNEYYNNVGRVSTSISGLNDDCNIIEEDPGFTVGPIFESGILTNFNELDLTPAPGSIAIDRGINNVVTTETDVIGNSRIHATKQNGVPTVDIGAYEYQDETFSITVTTDQDIVDETDGQISLREAILCARSGDVIKFDSRLTGTTIVLNGSELYINKSLVIDASDIGGIIIDGNSQSRVFYIEGSIYVDLINLSIQNGRACDGAAIYKSNYILTIQNCQICKNTASDDRDYFGVWGCIYSYAGRLVIGDTRVYENNGSGIWCDTAVLNITNSTIYGNNGYGVWFDWGELTVINCTVAGNLGNGIFLADSGHSYGDIVNTIVALNYYDDIYPTTPDSDISINNCIIGTDPHFVSPPIYSEPPFSTINPPISNIHQIDLHLSQESPAIDAGNNSYVATETDLPGNSRIVAAWREMPTVDIGAYEYQGHVDPPTPIVVTTLLDVDDATDGLTSLREAIRQANSYAVITFDTSLTGGTIILRGGELTISTDLTIDATSIDGITIDAYEQSRVFYIEENTSVWLIGLTVTGGRMESDGGGIFVANSGSLTLANSTVTKNTAFHYGGGIYNTGTLTITNSTVSGNAAYLGGAIYNYRTLTLTNSLLFGNTANYSGGGVYSTGAGYAKIINCTISGNSAEYDGAIDGTISYNSTNIENCIIALNSARSNRDIAQYYSGNSNYRNLIGIDPGFLIAPIFDETGNLINFDSLDFSLLPESPAIDAGDNSYVATETDVAGNPRVVNSIVDLGAYEYQSELPTIEITLNDWSGEYDGFAHSIVINDPYAETDVIRYSRDGNVYDLTANPGYTEVGTYTTFVKVNRSGYQDWYGSAIVEITPATISDITLAGWNGCFDNAPHAITVSDPHANTDTILYSIDGRNYDLTNNPQYTNVGTYTTYVKVSRNGCEDWYGSAVVEIGALVVTTLNDIVDSEDGLISLREAIASASDGNIISFSESLSGGTISLDGTPLEITKAITIDASGIGGIGIDGNGTSRVLYITGGTEETPVELTGLTISGGTVTSGNGGGIYNTGAVELRYCSVTGNSAGSGGGIYNSGQLTMFDCVVSDNTASSRGGGIFSSGSNSTLVLFGCTVSGNGSNNRGGGICNSNGEMMFYNTIIALNTARIDADINSTNSGGIIEAYHCLSSFTGWATSLNCLEYDSGLPLFANPVIGDYSLAHNSQAIDRGSNTYVETETDLAGNMRIANGIVDIGAYEYQDNEPEQLPAPVFTTGSKGVCVSYGANRHQIAWDAVEHASGYELAYSADGSHWTTISATDTSAVVTGLAYGSEVKYRVRALGTGSYTDSDWSAVKTFVVCPMDIDGDGDISPGDRVLMTGAWLSGVGDDEFLYAADINGDGDIGGADRVYLSNNWLLSVEDDADDLQYPPARVSDAVFAGFASADLAADLNVF